jgi:hypothetical protein
VDIYKLAKKEGRCPGLSFEGDMAVCGGITICKEKGIPQSVIYEAFGIGKGCCILAKAYGGGRSIDIASMPPYTKTLVAKRLREGLTIKRR